MNACKVTGRQVLRDGAVVARIGGHRYKGGRNHGPTANFGIRLINQDGSDGRYLALPGYTYLQDVVRDIDSLLKIADEEAK